MTVSRTDVQAFSAGSDPDAAIPDEEADRIAAVLNRSSIHRPSSPPLGPATQLPRGEVLRLMQRTGYSSAQIEEVGALLPEEVDSKQDRRVLERYGLTRALLMERFGSSP